MSIAPHEFWQEIRPPGTFAEEPADGFRELFPARLPDARQIALPIRTLPGDGETAVASLIVNQASFAVEDAFAEIMAAEARAFRPDVVIGVPTLGLPLANAVARRLGHDRMVALGTSRKFWYDDGLSEPMASVTSPQGAKRIYLDPRMLVLLAGRRVIVIDDVVSSGASMSAVVRLLAKADIRLAGLVFAMLQTRRWEGALADIDPGLPGLVRGAIVSPLLRKTTRGGWSADPRT